jgi:hypothetical protein
MAEEQVKDADYYRACIAAMMVKAQAAPSKATRRAYLNLATKWARQAMENSEFSGAAVQPIRDDKTSGPPNN